MFCRVIPCRGRSNLYGLRPSQSSNFFRVADNREEESRSTWPQCGRKCASRLQTFLVEKILPIFTLRGF
jgi:hypothetical protein